MLEKVVNAEKTKMCLDKVATNKRGEDQGNLLIIGGKLLFYIQTLKTEDAVEKCL